MTTMDPTDADLVLNGVVISEFAGLKGWKRAKETKAIETPGKVRHGVARQRGANGVDFTIMVKRSSIHLPMLDDFVDNQNEIPILAAIVRNLADYEVGQEIALGCEFGTLQGGERGLADSEDVGDVEFQVVGRGPIRKVKT